MSFDIGKKIINQLNKHGFEAYFVGGAVRDSLLGRKISDIDIATSAPPEKVVTIFPKTIPVGIEHGTVIVRMEHLSFEVTTFRRESNYQDYRHPSSVDFITSITEDLKRRDFTINAMALTVDGDLIDPFDGQSDIRQKVIKAVGLPDERFSEDPLRMMRAIRFLSMLDFSLDATTRGSIIRNKVLLEKIAVERLLVEFEKLLLGVAASRAINELMDTGLYLHLPGLTNPKVLQIFASYHVPTTWKIEEKWALLCYTCEIHEPATFLKKWKLSNQKIKRIVHLVSLLSKYELIDITDWFLYKEGLDFTSSFIRIKELLNQTVFSSLDVRNAYKELPIHTRKAMRVNGNDLQQWLNKGPGPWIQMLIEEIEKMIVTGKLENNDAAIKEWVRWRSQLETD